jgi:hypothetical protein
MLPFAPQMQENVYVLEYLIRSESYDLPAKFRYIKHIVSNIQHVIFNYIIYKIDIHREKKKKENKRKEVLQFCLN